MFLQNYYPDLYKLLTGDECPGTVPLEFALNNFTTSGRYVVASPNQGVIHLHLDHQPLERHEGQTALPIFLSNAR
jgi:hypothetical protein